MNTITVKLAIHNCQPRSVNCVSSYLIKQDLPCTWLVSPSTFRLSWFLHYIRRSPTDVGSSCWIFSTAFTSGCSILKKEINWIISSFLTERKYILKSLGKPWWILPTLEERIQDAMHTGPPQKLELQSARYKQELLNHLQSISMDLQRATRADPLLWLFCCANIQNIHAQTAMVHHHSFIISPSAKLGSSEMCRYLLISTSNIHVELFSRVYSQPFPHLFDSLFC